MMKRFASNIKVPAESSSLTKQIIKMHQSLMQACTPMNCKSAFRACGIISEVVKNGNKYKEIVYLDVSKCCKVRFFDISYIDQRLKFNLPLTEMQKEIYIKHLFPELANKSFRIPLESFKNEKK